jgi:exosortase
VRVQPTPRGAAGTGLALALGALLVWLYGSTLKGLVSEWLSSPDSSYGGILAAIALAVLWKRRLLITAATSRGSLVGFVFLTGALCAFLVGRFGADVFVTRVSLVLGLAGLIWSIGGSTPARVSAAPLCLLLIAVPLPALVVNAITLPMQLVASRMAEWMLASAHIPVFRDGNVLELQSTSLEVAEACSGLRSLISLTAIGCLVAWATERRLVRRAVVIAAAVPIALVLNAVRIAATGAACEVWGPQAASGEWHTFAGWITFVVAVGLLTRVQQVLSGIGRPHPEALREAAST